MQGSKTAFSPYIAGVFAQLKIFDFCTIPNFRKGSKSAIRRTQANVRSWHKHNAGTVPFRQLSAVRGHAWKLSALVGTGQIIIGCW